MNDYSGFTDETLVKMTLLNDTDAYGELVARHKKAVLGAAFKITNDRYFAEEAAQEAFVAGWIKLSSLKDRSRFRNWICTIAKNSARRTLSLFRSSIPPISLDAVEDTAVSQTNEADFIVLRDEVEKLSETVRQTVILHYFDGLSVKEIAERTGAAEGTVKWRLNEGRRRLRQGLEGMKNEKGSLVKKVMSMIEDLKRYRLLNEPTGFEGEFGKILELTKEIEDASDRGRAESDLLALRSELIPEKKDKLFAARLKALAENGKNDDAMIHCLYLEHIDLKAPEQIKLIKERQMPYVQKLGMKKTLGFLYFKLWNLLDASGRKTEAAEYCRQTVETLEPTEPLYASAVACLMLNEKLEKTDIKKYVSSHFHATGEVLALYNNRVYLSERPGKAYGIWRGVKDAIFSNAGVCDSIVFDPSLEVGGSLLSSDGQTKLTCLKKDGVFETPSGRFEKCTVLRAENAVSGSFAETAFCPGIGIVVQKLDGVEWKLKKYSVHPSSSPIPFNVGDRWEYTAEVDNGRVACDSENVYQTVGAEKEKAVMASYAVSGKLTDRRE